MYGYGRVITSCATPAKFANLSKLVSSYPVYHIGCRGREDLVNLMCDSNSMLPYPQVPNLAMLLFLAHDCNFTTVFLELQAKSSEIALYQTNTTNPLLTSFTNLCYTKFFNTRSETCKKLSTSVTYSLVTLP